MVDFYLARISDFIKEELTPAQKAGALLLLGLVLSGLVLSRYKGADTATPELVPVSTSKSRHNKPKPALFVHVAGAIIKPGLYQLDEGKRVSDAIQMAGGPSSDADMDSLNLAEKLVDGMKINVFLKAPPPDTGAITKETGSAAPGQAPLININRANESELDGLPGVGPATAKKIIDHREKNGSFKKPDELKNVKGIGDSKFEELKDKITIY